MSLRIVGMENARQKIRRQLFVCSLFAALLATALACGRVSATREFNYGVRYYNEHNYPAAVRAFERASQGLESPTVLYNLALSQLAVLKTAEDPSPGDARAALDVVTRARRSEGVDHSMQARLFYIAGSVHRLLGEDAKARGAFDEAVALERDYAPALRELVRLDTNADSALARFVLSVVSVEEPALEAKLPL